MSDELPSSKEIKLEKARKSFWEYRKLVNPKMIEGWWQKEISRELECFWYDLIAGKRPKLVIQSPPQHGKSSQIVDFISWVSGKNPDLKTIYGSYSERLGIKANLKLQRTFDSEVYRQIFPNLVINTSNSVTVSNQILRNREIIEYSGHDGFFRNTTVRGPVTGESLDLGVIDDPMKGRSEANSEVVRNSTWDWFTDDFFSRFSDHAGLLIILTRWHLDDPIGRMKEKFDNLKIVSYSAIASTDEKFRKQGEALFPELKPIEFLLERKKLMPAANWESLYQQNPVQGSGNLFSQDMFSFGPVPDEQDYSYITIDTSYNDKKENDPTSMMAGKVRGGVLYIDKIFNKQIKAEAAEGEVKQFMGSFVAHGFRGAYIEPKGHGIYLNQKLPLSGVVMPSDDDIKKFFKDRNLNKVERANNVLPYLSNRKIVINENMPNKDEFMAQILAFPQAKHDDMADCFVDMVKLVFAKEVNSFDWC